ncbi:MAG: lysophospholipid acyltransferase family protein [Candidatus Margulisiibacteriota bacterium]
MRLLVILITIIRYLPILFYFIITRPFHIYAYYFDRLAYYKALRSVAKFILFYLRIKLSIYGSELLPKSKKFLIVANHQSVLDILIMLSILPCAFIQRAVSYLPGFSWHFGKLSLIIDKEHPLTILRATRYVKQVTIEGGTPVALFPEATRSIDGTLGALHPGAASIAKSLNLPVLPVTIYNSREMLPKGAINSKSGVVLVAVQPLIEEEFIKNHSAEEIIQETKQRIQKGLDCLDQVKKDNIILEQP